MKITNLIEKLGSMEPDGKPFFSIYLNAESGQNGRDTFPIWLKKPLSDEEQNYKEDEAALGEFKAMADRIHDFVDNEVDPSANGIAIFAKMGDDYFEAVQLDVAFPTNKLFSRDRPHIFPLARAVHENPKYAVLWADKNKADIYVFGGETRIRSDVDVLNVFNENNVLGVFEGISSHVFDVSDFPGVTITDRQDFDRAFFDGRITADRILSVLDVSPGINTDARYLSPQTFQGPRTVRFGFGFQF